MPVACLDAVGCVVVQLLGQHLDAPLKRLRALAPHADLGLQLDRVARCFLKRGGLHGQRVHGVIERRVKIDHVVVGPTSVRK